MPSLVEIVPVVLEKKMKMRTNNKVYENNANKDDNTTTTMTDNGHILIIKAHLSLQLKNIGDIYFFRLVAHIIL